MNDIERSQLKITEVTLTSSDSHAIIRVQDNGRGIDEDVKDEIFNSFVTTKIDGVGLGLNPFQINRREASRLDQSRRDQCAGDNLFELHLPINNQ